MNDVIIDDGLQMQMQMQMDEILCAICQRDRILEQVFSRKSGGKTRFARFCTEILDPVKHCSQRCWLISWALTLFVCIYPRQSINTLVQLRKVRADFLIWLIHFPNDLPLS